MKILKLVSKSVLLLYLAGCSIYPLPQDTTSSLTYDIVAHVRCEARNGLRKTAINELRNSYFSKISVYKDKNGRHYTGPQLADLFEQDPTKFEIIHVKDLEPYARTAFNYYEQSQIAYEFSLHLTESNIDDINIGLGRNFTTRKDNIALSATSTRTRDVKRVFNIVDTFGELAAVQDGSYCQRPKPANIVYPLVGRLPVEDLISSFINTNEFGHLGPSLENIPTIAGTKANPAVSQMGDTIIFTTKFEGVVNPTFMLPAAAGMGFLPASAGFKTDDYREDVHQVDIVVSTSPDAAKLGRLRAKLSPPNGFTERLYDVNPRTIALKPAFGIDKTDGRVLFALQALQDQKSKNVQDAIIRIGNSLSRLSP